MQRKIYTVFIIVFVSISVIAITYAVFTSRQMPSTESQIDQNYLRSISRPGNSTLQMRHLAKDLIPPTNKWFSSIVFAETPQPVYPLPYSAKITSQGLEYGTPKPSASANTIAAPHIAALGMKIDGADDYRLSYYDDLVIRVQALRGGIVLGEYTLAQGIPFVWYQAKAPQRVTFQSVGQPLQKSGMSLTKVENGITYIVTSNDKTPLASNMNLDGTELFSFYGRGSDTSAAVFTETALCVVEKSSVSYALERKQATTTLRYHTKDGGSTLFAAMPHQEVAAKQIAGSYNSLYGTQPLYEGSSFNYSTKRVEPQLSLRLDALNSTEREQVIKQLQSDVQKTKLQAPDSYFGGKELYRAAQLYDIAVQLKQQDLANQLHAMLTTGFARFYQQSGSSHFFYDTKLKGMVSSSPAFGSENFNDHHFHYGYFLAASALLAGHDRSFAEKNKPMVDLLAADIASDATTKSFPAHRVYDAYAGHSWASGDGNFADGNNQESSSEPVHAWVGLGAWAAATDNKPLLDRANWLLSNEARTSSEYWLNFDQKLPLYTGYAHSITSLNWGGKRDYATFFSAEPTAILGIQLIPMDPTQFALLHNTQRAQQNLKNAAVPSDYNVQFGDYLLLYGAKDVSQTAQRVLTLSPETIDSANSKTYMLALLYAQMKP